MDRPPDIDEAIKKGDTERLRAAGKKGAEVTNKKRAAARQKQQEWEDALRAKAQDEELARKRSTNEHIITPDGEDISEDLPEEEW